MGDTTLMFVYGSLKRGFHNYIVMERANGVFISEARSANRAFSLFSLGSFPALDYATEGETPFYIKGELFEVPLSGVPIIDRLESSYKKVKITLDSGEVTPKGAQASGLDAYVYLLRPSWGKIPRLFPMSSNEDTVYWHMKHAE
ncbi:MAG: gamma-glutamylcyclotransferase [Microcystis sp. M110S1]|uniref:gamma-glutamylcyclotransferase family protein n=1 Tax=Microcystis sp. M110S1 TaxID=2771102 RepID=UPI002588FA3B|nr:gamma-glutamylcyclotransferase family protein [Microcystis sp. M110S1]MCA2973848.1 gamma-glutamylcyclotransferase [Microcystis sp. M110S1]